MKKSPTLLILGGLLGELDRLGLRTNNIARQWQAGWRGASLSGSGQILGGPI